MNESKRRIGAKRMIINIIITLLVGAIYYYFKLPAINLRDPSLYTFVLTLAIVFCVLSIATLGLHKANSGRELWNGIKGSCLIPVIICLALAVIYGVGNLISAPIFRAAQYRELLTVESGDFATEVEEARFDTIPMLDAESAARLGDRQMGNLPDLVSQFEVSSTYTQINYQSRPVRVAFLDYGDFFKWINNRGYGLPAYVKVDMVSQEATVVRLSDSGLEGIKYSPSELFNRKLIRHLRFNFPTFMFGNPTFELDEEGQPWWVAPRVVKKIGLFGGTDINGAVLVNAITGDCEYYSAEDIPSWVDRVYVADLIMQQYDYYGTYVNGFWNSIFGQREVTVTTSGANYIAMNDDVYMYTGVTSVSSDASNIGFLLSNQRTKETTYYPAPGAIETSAQASARGVVQDLGYSATFPLLLNIAGEPTYFMSLKDESQLVKQYAMVNVSQYQIVATGVTVAETEANYLKLLSSHNLVEDKVIPSDEVKGTIEDMRSVVIDGNTMVYIKLEDEDFYYIVSVKDSGIAALLEIGDKITLRTSESEGELRSAYDLERR